MKVRPFPALTPASGWADRISSVPYDVVTTREARLMASGNPYNFLRVVRADLEFPEGADPYADEVYARAKENFEKLQAEGVLIREPEPCLYFYRQVMGDHVQTGVAAVCHIDEYANNVIRKHETTRPVKENDRTRLIDTLNAQPGPVFLAYRDEASIDAFARRLEFETRSLRRFHRRNRCASTLSGECRAGRRGRSRRPLKGFP